VKRVSCVFHGYRYASEANVLLDKNFVHGFRSKMNMGLCGNQGRKLWDLAAEIWDLAAVALSGVAFWTRLPKFSTG